MEEGLPIPVLERVVVSMRAAADASGVSIVTGDTKVVEGTGRDELIITTAGLGVCRTEQTLNGSAIVPGDQILLSGDVGRHGIAVMSVREGLELSGVIESDAAPLVAPVMALLDAGIEPHGLRDLTRGGLASGVNELAAACGHGFRLRESAITVKETVLGACELLGLDPMYVANEGRFAAVVAKEDAPRALEVLQRFQEDAAIVGEVRADLGQPVILESAFGGARILDMLSGEQLPRIC
jgi:hydrogenase expression/formation protein HypE